VLLRRVAPRRAAQRSIASIALLDTDAHDGTRPVVE